jgi:hypothetical protein
VGGREVTAFRAFRGNLKALSDSLSLRLILVILGPMVVVMAVYVSITTRTTSHDPLRHAAEPQGGHPPRDP